jgi:hypothetical protein
MHVSIKSTMQRSKICFGSSSSPFASHVDLQSVCLILNYKASLVRMAQGAKVKLDMWILIITYLRIFLVNYHPYSPRGLQYICLILYCENVLGEIGSRSQS